MTAIQKQITDLQALGFNVRISNSELVAQPTAGHQLETDLEIDLPPTAKNSGTVTFRIISNDVEAANYAPAIMYATKGLAGLGRAYMYENEETAQLADVPPDPKEDLATKLFAWAQFMCPEIHPAEKDYTAARKAALEMGFSATGKMPKLLAHISCLSRL